MQKEINNTNSNNLKTSGEFELEIKNTYVDVTNNGGEYYTQVQNENKPDSNYSQLVAEF